MLRRKSRRRSRGRGLRVRVHPIVKRTAIGAATDQIVRGIIGRVLRLP